MLACPHCGDRGMVSSFLDKMDKIREEYGAPIIVSSGYRCTHYNNTISTAYNGPHTTGKAIDVPVWGEDAYKLVKIALNNKIQGIGLKQIGPRPWIWSY